jgi:hypothetical protein
MVSRGVWGRLVLSSVVAWACQHEKTKLEELNLTPEQAKHILQRIEEEKARSASSAAGASSAAAGSGAGVSSAASANATDPAEVTRAKLPEDNTPGSTQAASTAPIETQVLDPSLTQGNWIADGLVDVAPAAPMAATLGGVALINANNELLIAALGTLATSREPAATPIKPLPDDAGTFALGRGPRVADGYAYWVTSHFLLRRPTKVPYGPLDELAADARVGTRVSVLPASKDGKRPTWVSYVALPTVHNGPLRAKLWYGGEHELVLSDPNTSVLSVELVELDHQAYAVTLEARTGQSTLHARPLAATTPPTLGVDRVIWVGGSPNPLTELRTTQSKSGNLLGLLPVERDVTSFALGAIEFANLDATAAPSEQWFPYQNGINPAPVDAAKLCDENVLVFARPSTADPGSPQELVLLDPALPATTPALVLSTSKAFYDVSLLQLRKGALLTYVADHRTWARTLRCQKK